MVVTKENTKEIDFEKGNGLVPAIVQDVNTGRVLMLGYMNQESIEETFKSGNVTFFSRSKARLWTKGETSGNFLRLMEIKLDCDKDTLLVSANPIGPACHTGEDTCFGNVYAGNAFLGHLEQVIKGRKDSPSDQSYTSSLFAKGIDKIAQKVGEEAVEVVIASKNEDRELLLGELADLFYHTLVLLREKDVTLSDVMSVLEDRHK